jgi:CSLREA domain-containing protein
METLDMATRRRARQAARRRHRLAQRGQTGRSKTFYRRTPGYEPLEDRRLLALVTVNTLSDTVDLTDGLTSLREAIFATNLVAGADRIDFAPSLTAGGPATISLTHGQLRITDDLNVDGPGVNLLTLDATGSDPTPDENNGDGSQIFHVDDASLGTLRDVFISGLTLTGGDVHGRGGAILSSENLAVLESRLIGNAAVAGDALTVSYGGAIAQLGGNLTVSDTTIVNNSGDFGGGIYFEGGSLLVTLGVIAENTGLSGAGIYVAGGSGEIRASSIRNNLAGAFSLGGGLYNSGRLRIEATTISGNSADFGGGIFSRTDSTNMELTLIVNSTISGNTAFSRGGGVRNAYGETRIEFSTITSNTAPPGQGSGVASRGYTSATTRVTHSIIAGNTGSDVDFATGTTNTFDSHGYNLIGTGSAIGAFTDDGDRVGVANPLLGPLADNGGPPLPGGNKLLTHALLPGSPAINAGDLNAKAGIGGVPLYDQRGEPFSRVVNGRIDIGAFEYQAASDLNLVVDTLADESDGNHSRGDLSLREAIELANLYPSDDTIRFDPALTAAGRATILLTKGELRITDDVFIEGPGANLLMIDASGNDPTPDIDDRRGSRVINIDDGSPGTRFNVSIARLTLTGADTSSNGGGIRAADVTLVIANTTISNNAADVGAAVSLDRSAATFSQSTISNNTNPSFSSGTSAIAGSQTELAVIASRISDNEGAAVRLMNAGDTTIIDSTITNNEWGVFITNVGRMTTISGTVLSGSDFGPGAYIRTNGGNTTITNSIFSDNSYLFSAPDKSAGGITVLAAPGSITTVANSTVSGNVGRLAGGIVVLYGTATITHSFISGNRSQYGTPPHGSGGVFIANVESGEISDCSITNNVAAYSGGGISAITGFTGNIQVSRCTITGNTSLDGGGVFASGEVTIEACNISENSGMFRGGGVTIRSFPGTQAKIVRSTVADNSSVPLGPGRTQGGGGIYGSAASVIDSTVIGNTTATFGGGIFGFVMTISGSTISGNSANDGGGIWISDGTISQSTVSGNSAVNGGGIFSTFNSHVAFSTIAFNEVTSFGGGIFANDGTVELNHTIVARNTARVGGPDITGLLGATISPRYSLVGSNSRNGLSPAPVGTPDANGNLIGGPTTAGGSIDPRLGPLAPNGGPTMTHALLPGSPAVNAGDPAAMAGVGGVPEFDQRGAPFTRVYGGRIDIGAFEAQPNPLPGDYNFSGVVDAADVVVWRKTLNSTTDLRADGNGDGVVNQTDWQVWRANFGRTASEAQGARSEEQDAGKTGREAVGAPPQRPAWQPPASPGVSVATSRPAFRSPAQRFTPQEDLLASLASARRTASGRNDFAPTRRLPMRNAIADSSDPSIHAIDQVFETLGAMVAGTLY